MTKERQVYERIKESFKEVNNEITKSELEYEDFVKAQKITLSEIFSLSKEI